nr:hypothetical protein [Tanacetum cinerariifolium]
VVVVVKSGSQEGRRRRRSVGELELHEEDETPEVLIDFLRLVQRGLHAQVRIVRTDKGTKFLNKILHAYFASEGILYQTYSTQSRAYRVFKKRTRVIVETIHVNFDELPHMAPDHVSSNPVPQCQRIALEHDSLSLGPQCQENVPHAARTVTTSNEMDLLFSPMFDELLNGSTQVVSKSSAVTTADATNQYFIFLWVALALKILMASIRATGANDSSKSIPSSRR